MFKTSKHPYFYFVFLMLCLLYFRPVGYAELKVPEINQLLECYQQKMENLNGLEKYSFAFSNYPKERFYKLFIDKKRLANPEPKEKNTPPHLLFDVSEPGYYDGMMRAFQFMSTQVGKPKSVDLLISLHDEAVQNVKATVGNSTSPSRMEAGLSKDRWHYGIEKEKVKGDEAFVELARSGILLYQKWIIEQLRPHYPLFCDSDPAILSEMEPHYLSGHELKSRLRQEFHKISSFSPGDKNSIEAMLKPFFDHYSESISRLKTLDGKLEAIAELLRTIEVFHIFPDGNQRTVAFLLLNQLLIENNIPPVILEDPSVFDGYLTLKQLVEQLKIGISNFLNEGAQSHQLFLSKECQNIPNQPSYLSASQEYTPFFEVPGRPSIIEQMKSKFKDDVQARIKAGNFNKLVGQEGILPLCKAILYHDKVSIRNLLDVGADPTVNGFLPFIIAARTGNQEVFSQLLKQLPEKNRLKTSGLPVVINSLIANRRMFEFIPPTIQLLPPYEITFRGYGFLLESLKNGNLEAVKQLVKAGVSLDSGRDSEQLTPLMLAINFMRNQLPHDFADFLMDHTKDLNERVAGESALLSAIDTNNLYVVKKLLEKGAKITQTERDHAKRLGLGSQEIKRLILLKIITPTSVNEIHPAITPLSEQQMNRYLLFN